MIREKIAKIVLKERTKMRLTQMAFADVMGIDQKTVSMLETGDSCLSLKADFVESLCEKLGYRINITPIFSRIS